MEPLSEAERPASLPHFLRDPRGILRRRWTWMTFVLVAASAVATAVVLGWPMRYGATAKVLLSTQRIPEDFVRSTVSARIEEEINAMLGELLSRDSLSSVIEARGLDRGGVLRENLIGELRQSLTIEPETVFGTGRGQTGAVILAIRHESDDPGAAAAVANDLADRFIETHIRRRSRQTRLTSEFLRRETERAEEVLREQRSRVSEFKQRHRGELPGELQTALARLERLQQQRQSLALQISDAEGRLLLVQSQGSQSTDPRVQLLDDLRSRLVSARTIYNEEHPNVIALREHVADLEAELAQQGDSAGHANAGGPAALVVQRELVSLRAQRSSLEREIQDLDARVTKTPAREEELAGLEQREQVLRENYGEALRKLKEAELSESLEQAQQGFQVSRLELATPPTQPLLPRWKLALGALIAVVLASAATGALLEWIDRVILVGEDLESLTGMTNLGELPRM